VTWLLGLVVTAALVWTAVIYNRLVALDKRANGAWADIDAQLKRRHDLVPALVETVKGYATYEKQTLEDVIARRGAAVQSEAGGATGAEVVRLENLLAGSLKSLFVLAEAYPELRASERFGQLQQQLVEIEDALQHARRYYNAVVRDFNTARQRFPNLLVARPFGFGKRRYFELDSPLERAVVQVEIDV
jgi:LemA protein